MIPDALYLLGAPGVGKSTVMAAYLKARGWEMLRPHRRVHGKLVGHTMVSLDGYPSGVYLGKHRPEFPGTDALSMAVAPDAREWAASIPTYAASLDLIVGEGARLGNVGFLTALADVSRLTVVLLTASEERLTERRTARGSNQTPAWMRGAATGARNAFDRTLESPVAIYRGLVLDTDTRSPEEIAALL